MSSLRRCAVIGLVGLVLGFGLAMMAFAAHNEPVIEATEALQQEISQLRSQNEKLEARLTELEDQRSALESDMYRLQKWIAGQLPDNPTEEQLYPWVTREKGMSHRDLALALINAWLGARISEDALPGTRLTDYRIEYLDVLDDVPEGLRM